MARRVKYDPLKVHPLLSLNCKVTTRTAAREIQAATAGEAAGGNEHRPHEACGHKETLQGVRAAEPVITTAAMEGEFFAFADRV